MSTISQYGDTSRGNTLNAARCLLLCKMMRFNILYSARTFMAFKTEFGKREGKHVKRAAENPDLS